MADDVHSTFDEDKVPPVPSPFPAAGDQPAPGDPQYVLELFEFDGSQAEFRFKAQSGYLTVMKATKGWQRLVLASAVTGNPNAFVQLWKVPRPYPGPGTGLPVGELPNATIDKYQNFLARTSRMERIVLEGLPYDPQHGADITPRPQLNGVPDPGEGEKPSTKGRERSFIKTETIMIVRVSVRDGCMPRLIYAKQNFFVPKVTEVDVPPEKKKLHWSLQFAGYVASNASPGSTIVNCWKLPDSASLVGAMVELAHDPLYGRYIVPNVVREEQQLYSVISGAS